MIIFNLKNYKETTGAGLFKILDELNRLVVETPSAKDKIMIAPSTIHLVYVKNNYPELNIISQHVDSQGIGATTGWIPAEVLVDNGIDISLLNHSEHRVLPNDYIDSIHEKGLKIIACCENIDEAKLFIEKKVFGVAYEPKDLIGSGVSVTTRPNAVEKFVSIAKGKTKVLIGAGVSSGNDVKAALKLGADGVLLASALVKSVDRYKFVKDLFENLIEFS